MPRIVLVGGEDGLLSTLGNAAVSANTAIGIRDQRARTATAVAEQERRDRAFEAELDQVRRQRAQEQAFGEAAGLLIPSKGATFEERLQEFKEIAPRLSPDTLRYATDQFTDQERRTGQDESYATTSQFLATMVEDGVFGEKDDDPKRALAQGYAAEIQRAKDRGLPVRVIQEKLDNLKRIWDEENDLMASWDEILPQMKEVIVHVPATNTNKAFVRRLWTARVNTPSARGKEDPEAFRERVFKLIAQGFTDPSSSADPETSPELFDPETGEPITADEKRARFEQHALDVQRRHAERSAAGLAPAELGEQRTGGLLIDWTGFASEVAGITTDEDLENLFAKYNITADDEMPEQLLKAIEGR
jgi:hypothetical protein